MNFKEGFLNGSGGRTRTYDLRVMSPTSYQLLHPALYLNLTVLLIAQVIIVILINLTAFLCSRSSL